MGAIFKHTFAGHFEGRYLDDDGKRFHDEQAANDDQDNFMFGGHGDRAEHAT